MQETPQLTPAALAGVLADPRRMRVLAAIALGASTAEQIPSAAGVPAKEAAAALRRLQASGLVTTGAHGLHVDHDALRALAAGRTEDEATSDTPADLLPFIRGRRLLSLPAQRTRRSAVLRHVAEQTFVTGTDYDEPTVNALLASWCEDGEIDHAALRRYLVEGGMLSRGAGVYRFGAVVEPGPGERYVEALGLS